MYKNIMIRNILTLFRKFCNLLIFVNHRNLKIFERFAKHFDSHINFSKRILLTKIMLCRSEIVGAIKMRVYLSGMPELRLGLNDKVSDHLLKSYMH